MRLVEAVEEAVGRLEEVARRVEGSLLQDTLLTHLHCLPAPDALALARYAIA